MVERGKEKVVEKREEGESRNEEEGEKKLM